MSDKLQFVAGFPIGSLPPPRQTEVCRTSRPLTNPEFVKQPLTVAPVRFDFHEQLEMATMREQVFNVAPRLSADCLQARGAVANDDLLLRWSFDKDRAVDAREILA